MDSYRIGGTMMKVYEVVDNSEVVLTTTDRLKMLEKVYELSQKYENEQTWFWATEKELI